MSKTAEPCKVCSEPIATREGGRPFLDYVHVGTGEQGCGTGDGAFAMPRVSLECRGMGVHHSTDRVQVFRGKVEPGVFCGYHASQL